MKKVLALEARELELLAAACKAVCTCGGKREREELSLLFLEIVKQHPQAERAATLHFDLEDEIDGMLRLIAQRAKRGIELKTVEEARAEFEKIKDWAYEEMRGGR